MHRTRTAASGCLIALLAVLSCAAAPPRKAAPDGVVEQQIRSRLSRSKISRNNFQVKVQGGVATLTGRTDVVQHKGVATRLAKLGGAQRVDNQIVISDAARQKAAAQLAKGRRSGDSNRSEVKRAVVTRGG